jgi:hypothetical protein
MKSKSVVIAMMVFAGLLALASPCAQAQTGNATLTVTINGSNCDVAVFMQRTGGTAWGLGTSSFVFKYNSSAMTFGSVLTKGIWDAATSADYTALISTNYPGGARSVDIENNVQDVGTDIPTSATLVGTIRFTITNFAQNHNVTWDTAATAVTDLHGNDRTLAVTLTPPPNGPLPIQLSNFVASVAAGGQVLLHWTTLSEINNYGFEVQKAADKSAAFQSIGGSFTAGNGTTTVKHDYSYVDKSYTSGNVYRLKQTDLSGSTHFTDLVDPLGVTGVAGKPLPTVYSLSQNYPNPFNPSTVIEFALPKDAHVRLEVYNIIGQKVMTLVDEVRPAGYHSVKLDGTNLASGMYLYRLTTGQQTFMKKLLLMK